MQFDEPDNLSNPRSPFLCALIATILSFLLASHCIPWAHTLGSLIPIFLCTSACAFWRIKDRFLRTLLLFASVWVLATLRYESVLLSDSIKDFPENAPPRQAEFALQIDRVFGSSGAFKTFSGIARIHAAPEELSNLKNERIYFTQYAAMDISKQPAVGETWKARGIVSNLGQGDFAEYLSMQGVGFQMAPHDWSLIETRSAGSVHAYLESVRKLWKERVISQFGQKPQVAALLIALSLGDTSYFSDEARSAFFVTGTLHLFAISGLHILAVFGMLYQLFRLTKLPKPARIIFALGALGCFVLLVGAPPSAVRAFAVLLFLYSGKLFNRRSESFAILTACALMYLWMSPRAIHSLGFILSFSVVAAILLIGIPLRKNVETWMEAYESPCPTKLRRWYRRKIKRGLADSVCISVASFVGSAPWILAQFGVVTPFGIIANSVIVVIGMVTLFSLLVLAPIVISFDFLSPLLELPGFGARLALGITQHWSNWPIYIQSHPIAHHYYLPLFVLFVGLGFLYRMRVSLKEVKIYHIAIACSPILIYGITYPWQLMLFGSLQ